MSDEMKNCCPPETTAPKMEVHDASEGSKDIKPKMISTAHKRLSQDEFQRKVAMLAKAAAAYDMEKDAVVGAAGALPALVRLGAGGAAAAGKAAPWLSRLFGGGAAAASAAGKAPGMMSRMWGGAKSLATTGVLPSVANSTSKGWMPWLAKGVVGHKGLGSYMMHPAGLALGVGSAAMPYVGGAAQRLGSGLQSLGGMMGGSAGGGNMLTQFGNTARQMYDQASQHLGQAGTAGLIGAGLGAVGGAMMPGEEEYEDENGNIRTRRRGMLAGALRGAGAGGIAGGLAGAGMDYMGKMSAAQDFGAALGLAEKQAMDPAQLKSMMHGSARGAIGQSMMPNIAQRGAAAALSTVGGAAGSAANTLGRGAAAVGKAVNPFNVGKSLGGLLGIGKGSAPAPAPSTPAAPNNPFPPGVSFLRTPAQNEILRRGGVPGGFDRGPDGQVRPMVQ